MTNRLIVTCSTMVMASIASTSHALAATELQWWHAMSGANNEVVDQLAKEFNDSQKDYILREFYFSFPTPILTLFMETDDLATFHTEPSKHRCLLQGRSDGTAPVVIES